MKKIIVIIAATLVIVSCKNRVVPVEMKGDNNKSNTTFKVTRKSMTSFITIPGEFIPFEQVELFPKVNGFVKDVLVDRGYVVKKDQTLLTMEAPEIVQELVLAKSKLAETEADAS
jgi:multidrug efflux pump subunit AcrA (membrane-fusion protein)